jgi:GGDEF domain-containing protein
MVALKIIKKTRVGFTVNGKTFNMTASIAIGYACEAAVTSDALYLSADQTLYAAKNCDPDTFEVMECNVIDPAQLPSRRRNDARQRKEVGASLRNP